MPNMAPATAVMTFVVRFDVLSYDRLHSDLSRESAHRGGDGEPTPA